MHLPRPLRALPLALLLGVGLFGVPAAEPPSAAAVGPLPECRLDDILTEPRGYDDWAILQVDWILTLGPDYKPPDLVSVRNGGVAGGGYVREVVIDDLKALAAAAKANGTPLVAWSPYRSYKQQLKLFNGYAGWNGKKYTNFDDAIQFSARPGHSEHQTGLTIDFVAVGDDGLTSNWEVTRTGGWMAKNAWKYGWLMSYPKGKQSVTCYSYEPWHYRYVGRDLAAKIHDSGLTIREYLWANYTQVDPACVALEPPPLVTPGVPRSCALAEASPSPTAPGPSSSAASAPPGSPPAVSASPGSGQVSAAPTPASTSEPSPTGVLAGAIPIALALIVVLAAVLGYAGWRATRRPRGRATRRR